jgi:hypothetical protein
VVRSDAMYGCDWHGVYLFHRGGVPSNFAL